MLAKAKTVNVIPLLWENQSIMHSFNWLITFIKCDCIKGIVHPKI